MNTNPIHILLAVGVLFIMCNGSSSSSVEDDEAIDDSDYQNASWNPSSVNYNG
ncbi:hypothetical protein [Massilia aurea]|uniref:hypothetical protein n=1 Tax=Massilia aurea TaxID=373040 RepID=UPI0031D0FE4B